MRRLLLAVLLLLLLPAAARGADGPLGLTCSEVEGLRQCEGLVPTWDGVPLDTNLVLPAGAARDLPLVVHSHGWGGGKEDFGFLRRHAARGYAVLSFSARGFRGSCGTPDARLAGGAACARGWLHLDDVRYEARDVQHVAGLLADEGVVDGRRVGAVGGSYGGGVSLMLAILRDRVQLPDDRLVPWTSPKGEPMRIAAAAPSIPWTDLVQALAPNGRELDYAISGPEASRRPAGVLKASFVAGLFGLGTTSGNYAPPLGDPDADLIRWYLTLNAGEPYDGNPLVEELSEEIVRHHSPYHLDDSQEPAPTFLSSGWTDDLFPVDETVRWWNRTRARHPGAQLALMALDFGHQRAQNKEADASLFHRRVDAWLDLHLLGRRSADVPQGVEALTVTCGEDAPSEGPYRAATWPALHPGEVRHTEAGSRSFTSAAGDVAVGQALDPITGPGACATTRTTEPGTAVWDLPPAEGEGYTLLGSPTIHADVRVTGVHAQIAGRLWDVAPDGTQTLVARGVYRPDASGRQVWQLHPGAWRFKPGHRARLQLLGRDLPYVRPSNGAFSVEVADLELRLPVRERPGTGPVVAPAPPVLPEGATLAPDVSPAGGSAPVRGTAAPRKPRLGLRARCLRGRRLQVRVSGADARQVRRIRLRGRSKPGRTVVVRRTQARRLRATVRLADGRTVKLARRAPRCR